MRSLYHLNVVKITKTSYNDSMSPQPSYQDPIEFILPIVVLAAGIILAALANLKVQQKKNPTKPPAESSSESKKSFEKIKSSQKKEQ